MGKRTLIAILFFYKKSISPFLPRACRFYPSCSQYTIDAVDKYGVGRGLWLGIKRLARCNPFCPGGLDLVP